MALSFKPEVDIASLPSPTSSFAPRLSKSDNEDVSSWPTGDPSRAGRKRTNRLSLKAVLAEVAAEVRTLRGSALIWKSVTTCCMSFAASSRRSFCIQASKFLESSNHTCFIPSSFSMSRFSISKAILRRRRACTLMFDQENRWMHCQVHGITRDNGTEGLQHAYMNEAQPPNNGNLLSQMS